MKSPFLRRFGMPSPFFDNEAGFSPTVLLTGSTAFLWYDPSDLPTLFQNAAGTTPVTAPAQPVGLVLDKSQGLVLGSELRTATTVVSGAWTQAGGVVTAPGTSGAADNVSYTLSAATVAGRFYEVAIPNTMPGGSFYVDFGSGTGSQVGALGSSTQRIILTCTASGSVVRVGRWTGSPTGTIGPISVRELPGFHATQATAASRPTYGVVPSRGRVNLLTYTEQFDNAVWGKTAVTANGLEVRETTANSGHATGQIVSLTGTYTFSLELQAVGRDVYTIWMGTSSGTFAFTYTFSTNTLSVLGTALSNVTATVLTGGWVRFTGNVVTPNRFQVSVGTPNSVYVGDPATGFNIRNAQLETGSTATTYQRVVSQFDVTDPVGFPSYPLHYLFFGGDLDPRWLQTAAITPNADKVQVFTGVQILTDDTVGVIAELSASSANNGTFSLRSRTGASAGIPEGSSRGTINAVANSQTVIATPSTNVLTLTADISGDIVSMRRNGVQRGITTTDQGTGNYLAYPLYIGRRGGTSFPFNGQLYGLITRFSTANLDASVISQTERWMGQKTGVTI